MFDEQLLDILASQLRKSLRFGIFDIGAASLSSTDQFLRETVDLVNEWLSQKGFTVKLVVQLDLAQPLPDRIRGLFVMQNGRGQYVPIAISPAHVILRQKVIAVEGTNAAPNLMRAMLAEVERLTGKQS